MNKVTIILHVLIISLLFVGVFIDRILDLFINDQNEKIIVTYEEELHDLFYDYDDDFFIFQEGYDDDEINILYEDLWVLESRYSLDPLVSAKLKSSLNLIISEAWLNTMSDESAYTVLQNISPEITERTKLKDAVTQDKIKMSMFLITGIYFAMLSFSTMIANEVVYEKTSKVLEVVLTSVSTKTHYFSKMIVAWLTVMIQLMTVGLEIILVLALRNFYDEGSGFLNVLQKYQILEYEANSFKALVELLGINRKLISILCISLLFMIIGVVLVQMIMVTISSFINSVEESGVMQAPVYLVFLVIYYIALALNNPRKLNDGLGYYLSMCPIVSMLFMPMRLLLVKVSIYEIMMGLFLNLISLIILSYYGAKLYGIGILGGFSFTKKKKNKT